MTTSYQLRGPSSNQPFAVDHPKGRRGASRVLEEAHGAAIIVCPLMKSASHAIDYDHHGQ